MDWGNRPGRAGWWGHPTRGRWEQGGRRAKEEERPVATLDLADHRQVARRGCQGHPTRGQLGWEFWWGWVCRAGGGIGVWVGGGCGV